jgi:hypothetical protein
MNCIFCDAKLSYRSRDSSYMCLNEKCLHTCSINLIDNQIIGFFISLSSIERMYWFSSSKDKNYLEIDFDDGRHFKTIYKNNYIQFNISNIKAELQKILNRILKLKAFI